MKSNSGEEKHNKSVYLAERSPRGEIQFDTTAQSRKGRSPLQFKQMLGRAALCSKALYESSLDVSVKMQW